MPIVQDGPRRAHVDGNTKSKIFRPHFQGAKSSSLLGQTRDPGSPPSLGRDASHSFQRRVGKNRIPFRHLAACIRLHARRFGGASHNLQFATGRKWP